MDYLYENLGPERFQEFCQALLVKEYPDVQCFPIGQPDGGRDAVAYLDSRKRERTFQVFQVKYVRNPQAQPDPHKWLMEILEEEAPKVDRLIPKGARAYYLITNVPGTSHLDAGAIDKTNDLLSRYISVPSFCWWRDDLNRRLDSSYDLKWRYSDILAGIDLLRLIIEENLSPEKQRRANAIRAFLRTQYEDDKEVRFSQVELRNQLLDLFVDVPIAPLYVDDNHTDEQRKHHRLHHLAEACTWLPDRTRIGAARFLLAARTAQQFPQIVLEGVPGQGKSTLSQFLCQAHRMRVLQDDEALDQLQTDHKPSSIRIPFKVDLRDFATWLDRKDPFAADDANVPPSEWADSLEAFLAAQVRQFSGGAAFSVSDLHAVAETSAILLVLDGLDEVADVAKRRKIVAHITSGVNRMQQIAASLQAVVTTRPSIYTSTSGFNRSLFPHFQLVSLSKPLVHEYAQKWQAARRFVSREAANVCGEPLS